MSTYTCVIIDDEPYAIALLSTTLNTLYKNIVITKSFTNWKDAIELLRHEQPDILFLDVAMPGKTGFDTLRLLPNLKSEIIFITAYGDYALEAFKFMATGYILKPIDDIEFTQAVDKAIERIENKKTATSVSITPKIGIANNKGTDYVNVEDIVYLEAWNKYTKIFTITSQSVSSYNIGRFKHLLGYPIFCQVHRSYIVNLNYITRYEAPGQLIMLNKKEIPVSKNFREDFLEQFVKVARIKGMGDIE